MHISSLFFSLQPLVLGTAYADLAGSMSSSQAKPAATSIFQISIPTSNISSSGSAASLTGTDDAISLLEDSYLTCHNDSPMANMTESQLFVETCSKVGKKITLLVTRFNVELKLLRYIEPAIPQQLLALDLYAYALEAKHGCQTLNQEEPHCIWLSQLIDELFQLMVKTGGPEHSLNLNLLDNGYCGNHLKALNRVQQEIFHELEQIAMELDASMSLGLLQRSSVIYKTVIEGDRLQKLLERAANLEKEAKCPEHGTPIVCIALAGLKGMVASTLDTLNGGVPVDA